MFVKYWLRYQLYNLYTIVRLPPSSTTPRRFLLPTLSMHLQQSVACFAINRELDHNPGTSVIPTLVTLGCALIRASKCTTKNIDFVYSFIYIWFLLVKKNCFSLLNSLLFSYKNQFTSAINKISSKSSDLSYNNISDLGKLPSLFIFRLIKHSYFFSIWKLTVTLAMAIYWTSAAQ